MSQSEQKVVQYLGEAHASEIGLVSVLRRASTLVASSSAWASFRELATRCR
jgi:hypothetical protein